MHILRRAKNFIPAMSRAWWILRYWSSKEKRNSEDNTSTFMSILLQNTSYKSVFSIYYLSSIAMTSLTTWIVQLYRSINTLFTKITALPCKKMHSETTTLYPLLNEIFTVVGYTRSPQTFLSCLSVKKILIGIICWYRLTILQIDTQPV